MAFVDILGFADEVKKLAKGSTGFHSMVTALLSSSAAAVPAGDEDDLLSILASQEGEDKYGVDLQAAFFSDSTFVSARNVVGGTDKVLSVVLRYARHLLRGGFFVRGGIARGRAAQRAGIVVGPAVLAAYLMEQKAAVYPRVVVEDTVARELLAIADQPNATATIRRGEDGLFFVDILTTLGLRDDGEAVLRESRKLIVERLKKRRSPDIDAKWRWLAAQFNRAVRSAGKGLSPIERLEVVELPDDP